MSTRIVIYSWLVAPTPRQIGISLRRIRKGKGLSQYALAKATKPQVSREYIRKLEAGGSDPTVGMLQRLAKALGVPVTEFLEWDWYQRCLEKPVSASRIALIIAGALLLVAVAARVLSVW
jgi:transcriptional regulator with XRE-family HTH domain